MPEWAWDFESDSDGFYGHPISYPVNGYVSAFTLEWVERQAMEWTPAEMVRYREQLELELDEERIAEEMPFLEAWDREWRYEEALDSLRELFGSD